MEQKDNFNALYEIAQHINSILDPIALLEKILEIAMNHLSAERGLLLLIDPAVQSGFTVVAARNFSTTQTADQLAASSSVIRTVLETREPVLSIDAPADRRFDSSQSIVMQNILSIVCIPLRNNNRLLGAVYLDSTRSRSAFTAEAVKFLTVFGDLSAISIENARQFAELRNENTRLRYELSSPALFKGIIGRSKAWLKALDIVKRVLDVDVAVLITGESGTGKDIIARAIHANGSRATGPFVAVNCSAIPENLLESELFGHARGAFTGAHAEKKGLIEMAERGIVFLDEIADLPTSLQAKLLHVLQQKEIRRIGEVVGRNVDVRIVAATNKNLQEEMKTGKFREDLFFRLNVVSIHLPPLRERPEDIPLLAEYFLTAACETHRKKVSAISPEAMQQLMTASWPGNVRELQNVIERAAVLSHGTILISEDLFLEETGQPVPETGTLSELEQRYVQSVITRCGGNRKQTAQQLGVSLRWLQYKLKEWNIE